MSSHGVSFGKADSPDDASEQDEEGLRQQVRELREKVKEERLKRKELKKQFESEISDLRKQVEELQEESVSEESADVTEIEWEARNAEGYDDYQDMTSNVRRAVKVWEELPNLAASRKGNLVLTYDKLKTAISVVDNCPKNEVNSVTVKRVRKKLREMAEDVVMVDERPGKTTKKHHRVVVTVEDWATQRPDVVVQQLLPEKVAETVLGGGER